MINRLLFSYTEAGLLDSFVMLILRLSLGGMMLIGHGWSKIQSFTEKAAGFPDPLGIGSQLSMSLAIFAEASCAALVILGLCTRLATIPLLITMAVAAGIQHAADPWSKKELAIIYGIGFLVIFLRGAGRFSLDYVLGRR